MMYEPEKSDSAIVAMKPANKTAVAMAVAEWVEPRAGTKGNMEQPHTRRTQSRCSVSQRLNRVRNAARQRKKEKFCLLELPFVDRCEARKLVRCRGDLSSD
jgi:RNA-directed DNA polymerase